MVGLGDGGSEPPDPGFAPTTNIRNSQVSIVYPFHEHRQPVNGSIALPHPASPSKGEEQDSRCKPKTRT